MISREQVKKASFLALNQLGIDKAFRRITARKARIVTYHGVVKKSPRVFNWQQIPENAFIQQMVYLKRNFRVIPLPTLLDELFRLNRIVPRSLAITFDDGYENNFSVAYPILTSLKLPATFFISTSFIGNDRVRLWYETLYDAIIGYPEKSIDLSLIALGKLDTSSPNSKENCLRCIIEQLKPLPDRVRQSRLDDILNRLGWTGNQATFPEMTWEQLMVIAKDPMMTIGGHGHSHAILTKLSNEAAQEEIITNKRYLEANLNRKISIFSYPNGESNKYIIDCLKRAGFTYAVTTKEGLLGSNPYLIERMTVRNPSTIDSYRTLISGITPIYKKMFHDH
jgi:peptidoglycan/xylan/chitin deacetylase (PgdA/CDA1 family)